MPTYEYRCRACGHHLEIVQAFSDDAITTCPTCQAGELRKVFGSVGISFKGSGFYKNDSRSKTSSSSSSTSSTSSSGSEGGSASGSGSSGSPSSDSSSSTSSSNAKASTTKSSDAKSA